LSVVVKVHVVGDRKGPKLNSPYKIPRNKIRLKLSYSGDKP